MSRIFITLLLTAGALLQIVLKPWGVFGTLELPILIGLMICIALHTEPSQMFYAAVLAGLLHDAFCPAPLGLSIPFYIALASAVNWIRDKVFGDLPATYILMGAAATVLETLYYALVFTLSGLRPVSPLMLLMRLAGGLLAGATIVPLISLLVLKLRTMTLRNRRRFI